MSEDTRRSAIPTAEELAEAAGATAAQNRLRGVLRRDFGPAMVAAIAKMNREQAIEEIGELVKHLLRVALEKVGI